MAHDRSERTAAPDAKAYHEHHSPKKDVPEGTVPEEKRSGSLVQKFERFVDWYNTHKKVSLPVTAGLFVVLFFAIPFTRYTALGLFLKQDFSVVVLDVQSGRPVSTATVHLHGQTASTNGKGEATLRVPVGTARLEITKTYYKTFSQAVTVTVGEQSSAFSAHLEATGRVVPVTVLSNIGGKAVAGATVTAGHAQAKTDDKGQATLVVPASDAQIAAKVTAEGYNTSSITVKVGADDEKINTFKITPTGKVYFLSNQNGTIDVVKSDLDGQNRQTVLAGTGKEGKGETVLLATRDWKYLALLSKRDGGGNAKLFLINTRDDSLSNMDEGDANFRLVGWEGHRFLYVVERYKMKSWEPNGQALKSFDADSKKLTTIDQATAEGSNAYDYKREYFSTVYVVSGRAVYGKNWEGNYYDISSKHASLVSVLPEGSEKKTIKTFDTNFVNTIPYAADELYLVAQDKVFEYGDNTVKELPDKKAADVYETQYVTYLASPDGKQTFWSQDRDGKLVFFVGNTTGDQEKRVATLSTEYSVFGWYTDQYLIVSKKGSELYIMPANGVTDEAQLFKITDYYKPYYSYPGYGGGYGGL